VGVTAGVLVLGEPLSYRLVLGGVIVALGIALVQGRLLGPREPAVEAIAQVASSGAPTGDWPATAVSLVPSFPLAMGV
jgi:hypothetical protein